MKYTKKERMDIARCSVPSGDDSKIAPEIRHKLKRHLTKCNFKTCSANKVDGEKE